VKLVPDLDVPEPEPPAPEVIARIQAIETRLLGSAERPDSATPKEAPDADAGRDRSVDPEPRA